MKQLFLVLFYFFCAQSKSQQLQTYSFEQVEQLVGENPRPILLYFYTNSCSYCKMLQNTTFKNEKVITKLNTYYYVIFFNAQSTKSVYYKNKEYKFIPQGFKKGYHELVYDFLKNRQEIYPTLIFLDHNFNELLFLQSYLSTAQILELL